jgi:hypothetical protein
LLQEGLEHRRDPTFAKLADIVMGNGHQNTVSGAYGNIVEKAISSNPIGLKLIKIAGLN